MVGHSKSVIRHCPEPHDATGRFDFVLANPLFSLNALHKERWKVMVASNRRFAFSRPRTDNVNYLWIQLFHSALNEKGRAGFVMINFAKSVNSCSVSFTEGFRESVVLVYTKA